VYLHVFLYFSFYFSVYFCIFANKRIITFIYIFISPLLRFHSKHRPISHRFLWYIAFTQQQVNRAISKLKATSAGGPDGIPPFFSKTVVLTLMLHWHLCTSCFSILPACR